MYSVRLSSLFCSRLNSQPSSGMWLSSGTPEVESDLSWVTMPPMTIVPPFGTMISLVEISRDVLGGGMFGSAGHAA